MTDLSKVNRSCSIAKTYHNGGKQRFTYSHWDLTKQFQWAMKVLITVNLKIK